MSEQEASRVTNALVDLLNEFRDSCDNDPEGQSEGDALVEQTTGEPDYRPSQIIRDNVHDIRVDVHGSIYLPTSTRRAKPEEVTKWLCLPELVEVVLHSICEDRCRFASGSIDKEVKEVTGKDVLNCLYGLNQLLKSARSRSSFIDRKVFNKWRRHVPLKLSFLTDQTSDNHQEMFHTLGVPRSRGELPNFPEGPVGPQTRGVAIGRLPLLTHQAKRLLVIEVGLT